jgi:hypothetical protein
LCSTNSNNDKGFLSFVDAEIKGKSMKAIPHQFKGGRLLDAIAESEKITGIGQAILFDLTRFCDLGENATFQEWVWRKREDLVKGTKFDIKAINRHIKILIKDGYIDKRKGMFKGKQAANEFRLTSKIFDEYLAVLGYPNEDTHKVTGYPNADTIHNNVHNNVKSAADGSDRIVLEKSKPNRTPTSVNVPNTSNHDARAYMNVDGRSDEEKPSPEVVKSWELSQAIFGLTKDGKEHRKEIYKWMDDLFRDHGEFALGFLENAKNSIAETSKTWTYSTKTKKRIEAAIKKLKDETINQKHYQDADDTWNTFSNGSPF